VSALGDSVVHVTDFLNADLSECLLTILNEEWEHRLYAERDFAGLEAPAR
jgi:hypothetical protein